MGPAIFDAHVHCGMQDNSMPQRTLGLSPCVSVHALL